jgi:hypothetical protein
VRAISGYDYSSGAVGADGNGNRTPSQQSGHVDVITFTEYTGRSATNVTEPLSKTSSSSNMNTKALTTV